MDGCKRNIIERMGGPSYFDVIVFQMCERTLEDKRLQKYFGQCHIDDLFDMQRVLMNLAICEFRDEEAKQKVYYRATLQHYRLFELGLDVNHFDILKSHLIASLEYSWCDADVMKDLLDLFESLRTDFYQNAGRLTCCVANNNDEEEFELALKTEDQSRSSSKTQGVSKGTDNDKTLLKGIRQFSGENLLSMLKLNRTKRPKSSTNATFPQ